MEVKCNKCGDIFYVEILDKWSSNCFHCDDGKLIATGSD